MNKGIIAAIISGILALGVAVTAIICLERVPVGYIGVIYSAEGVEDQTFAQGWHMYGAAQPKNAQSAK